MSRYEKPVITVDVGLAEGVYAASGAGNGVSAGSLSVVNNWGGGGQAMFTLDLSNANRSQLTVTVTFNNSIGNGWGGGAAATVSGNKLVLYWHSAPETAEITVQENSAIAQLQITCCSASNS